MENSHRPARIVAGAGAGVAATVLMTWTMAALQRLLPQPPTDRDTLPPRHVVERAAAATGVDDTLSARQLDALTLAAHFGYGASVGAIYAALPGRAPRPLDAGVSRGIAFGLAVFASSYLGLLPALGLHPPATRWRGRRVAVMALAHVVWGASLGATLESLHRAQPGVTQRRTGRLHRAA